MKLSNILNVETRPFDAATYEPAEEETVIDESGKRRVRLRDQNVIRWRVRPGGPDGGAPAIESNARCAAVVPDNRCMITATTVATVTDSLACCKRVHSCCRVAVLIMAFSCCNCAVSAHQWRNLA